MSQLRANVLYSYVESDLQYYLPSRIIDDPGQWTTGWPGAHPQQVAACRLLTSLLKKHAGDVYYLADERALQLFLDCNQRCAEWLLPSDRSLVEDVILGELRDVINKFWYRGKPPYYGLVENPLVLLDEGYMGPGASLRHFGNDFYTKLFSGPVTATSSLLVTLYHHWCGFRPSWSAAEKLRNQHFATHIVRHNRLSFVPKSTTISRTICIEPGLNMFYQLGLKQILESRLKSFFGIDLSKQQAVNRELARTGSVDGSFATIDLSSASDTISLSMLRWLLPKQMLELLELLRAPQCQLPNGESVDLHMISTMGNGYTFPLQTLIFASVVSAVYRIMGIPLDKGTYSMPNFGVNGDDIIVVGRAYSMVVKILQLLGFKVNAEKSFFEGHFRESCGADWFQGFPVRGFYLKDQTDPIAPYVAYNRLTAWSASTEVNLRCTSDYLLKCGKFIPVPFAESDSAGYKVSSLHLRLRRGKNGSYSYTKLVPNVRYLSFGEDIVNAPRGERRRMFNPDGVFVTAVGGYLSSGRKGEPSRLSLRNENPSYRTKPATWPHEWDWVADGGRKPIVEGAIPLSPPPGALRRARTP